MVTNLIDCEVEFEEDGAIYTGTIRGLYLESTDLMAIIEVDGDSELTTVQLHKCRLT